MFWIKHCKILLIINMVQTGLRPWFFPGLGCPQFPNHVVWSVKFLKKFVVWFLIRRRTRPDRTGQCQPVIRSFVSDQHTPGIRILNLFLITFSCTPRPESLTSLKEFLLLLATASESTHDYPVIVATLVLRLYKSDHRNFNSASRYPTPKQQWKQSLYFLFVHTLFSKVDLIKA